MSNSNEEIKNRLNKLETDIETLIKSIQESMSSKSIENRIKTNNPLARNPLMGKSPRKNSPSAMMRRNPSTSSTPNIGQESSHLYGKSNLNRDKIRGVNPIARIPESIPIEINQAQFDRIKDTIKAISKHIREKSESGYNLQKNILKTLQSKLMDRLNYLNAKASLTADEKNEVDKINKYLNQMNQVINSSFETRGGRKSRRYNTSKGFARTRKYKK